MMVACYSSSKCNFSNMNCNGHFVHLASIIFYQFLSASTVKLQVKTGRSHTNMKF